MAIELRRTFPFSAIVGQERMKLALVLNAINPSIGGVLIRGEKGTAKSTAVRALARLLPEQEVVEGCRFGCSPDADLCWECLARREQGPLPTARRRMRVVELPINASEDRVVGTIDLEAALREGARRFEPGVLAEANRNVLYVDEVNLLDDHIVDVLLDAAAMGVNTVEREGVSVSHPSRFILVGTMNPEEGELRPQLLDRFGLCVDVEGIRDLEQRVEISVRADEFRTEDPTFTERWAGADREIAGELASALATLPSVTVGTRQTELISRICLQARVMGHRGDLVTERATRAITAWRQHPAPTGDDIYDAAELALAHRAQAPIERGEDEPSTAEGEQQQEPGDPSAEKVSSPDQSGADAGEESGTEADSTESEGGEQAAGSDQGTTSGSDKSADGVADAEDPFQVRKLELPRKRPPRRQTGKRAVSKSNDRRGRYVRAQTQERVNDLAVDATVRAAAPFQRKRGRALGEPLRLEHADLHQKIRERKVGNLIVFVVDASASMDAEQRMTATKGAILSLLQDAYVRRDRVAVVVFRNRSAEVVLRPTSSVQLAQRRLERMPVGGTTPLTHGLMAGYQVIKNELARDPSMRSLLVLISDGRGNISLFKEEPLVEAQKVAALIQSEKIDSLVIDSARDFSRMPSVQHLARVAPMYQTYAINACADLAERMGAQYYGLYDLSREEIASAVDRRLGRRR
ncbi:MAG: magnesium chelatase subunit D family protein [Candidatus Dormiibacterota bacterium]